MKKVKITMELRSKLLEPRPRNIGVPVATAEIAERTRRRFWMFVLEVLFFIPLVAVSYIYGQIIPIAAGWWPVLFGLATIRLARSISFNEIGETLRAPFTEVRPDSSRAGANIHPKGNGLQYVLGALIACPICIGTWAALFLWAVWTVFPWLGPNLVMVMAFAGASEGLHWAFCMMEWTGRKNRVISGRVCPDNDTPIESGRDRRTS